MFVIIHYPLANNLFEYFQHAPVIILVLKVVAVTSELGSVGVARTTVVATASDVKMDITTIPPANVSDQNLYREIAR